MKPNMGTVDRAVRVVLGIALLGLLWMLEGNARWLGLIGIVPLATASLGWCPLYTVLGVSTCPRKA